MDGSLTISKRVITSAICCGVQGAWDTSKPEIFGGDARQEVAYLGVALKIDRTKPMESCDAQVSSPRELRSHSARSPRGTEAACGEERAGLAIALRSSRASV